MDNLERFAHPTYLIRKKVLKLFGGAFHLYDPDGNIVLYSQMKAFKLKEDIRLFSGEDMQEELLAIRARQIVDFSAAYDVVDSVAGGKVGALRRRGFKSMFKDEWTILDEQDQELGEIKEDSTIKALVRRNVELVSFLLPQRYHAKVGAITVSTYQQNFNPFIMKLTMDFTSDTEGLLDRRLGIAAGVVLCAIEGKQS